MYKSVITHPDFPQMEKKWLDHWYKSGVVARYLTKNNDSDKRFSFQDGPITANNPMGVHHAWGRTYKDVWQRFYNLLGFKQRFQNGFDCQGLWVEVEVEKELGLKSKKDIENLVTRDKKASIAKFVDLCKQRVRKFATIQTDQTKRLGNFMDWDNSYFTMSDENNYMIWHFLKKCFDFGWIYKAPDSVPWCPRCETAISQHEMLTEDYKETMHESVYLKFEILNPEYKSDLKSKIKNLKSHLLVWTTTPWTLPANIAVAVDESYDYSLVEMKSGDLLWIAHELIEIVLQNDYKKIVKTVKGRELVGLKYKGSFDALPAVQEVAGQNKNFHTVIATDALIMPITLTEGTGMVHTAVSAGTEDFQLGKKLGLPMIPVIADNADYLENFGFLSGKNAKKNPSLIVDYLDEKGFVYKIHNYKHRYPACWRCKTELVWKVEEEWYIAMDRKVDGGGLKVEDRQKGKTFRQMMIEVAKKIKWLPEFGLERELDWLEHMHDWLISKKNRYWGLALPIYECKKCGNFEVLGTKEELKKRAVSGWSQFEGKSPHKPYVDEVKIGCGSCGEVVSRIADVGNPWLDAGIVPYSTISKDNKSQPLYLENKQEWKKWAPVNFITESFPGQFKNWFYALIAMSTVLENIPPFKTVLGFGTLLGEDGRPMHKSWGNAIEFNEGADKIGVDVMRWMYARQNPAENMLFGFKHADEVRRQFYLMLWNVYKFFVEYAHLDKFKIQKSKINNKIQNSNLETVLDQWILNRLFQLIYSSKDNLLNYNLKDVAMETEKFVSDLSTWYIRRSRDRVWINSENTDDKQAFYQTLHNVLVNLSLILSPIMPFITEEIYTNLTNEPSVHLASWPSDGLKTDQNIITDMDLVRKIVEVGHRIRKENSLKVRQVLSAAIINLPKGINFRNTKNINDYHNLIMNELNVKKVELVTGPDAVINVNYDTNLTPELKEEGMVRDLIRQIQQERKKMGLNPDEMINVTLPDLPEKYRDLICRKVVAKQLTHGVVLKVSRMQ